MPAHDMKRVQERVMRAVAQINNRVANSEFDKRFDTLFRAKFNLRWYRLFCKYQDRETMSATEFSERVKNILEWFSGFVPMTLHETTIARELLWQWLGGEELGDLRMNSHIQFAPPRPLDVDPPDADTEPEVDIEPDAGNDPLRAWMHLCTLFYASFATRGTLYSVHLVFGLLPTLEADAGHGPSNLQQVAG
jgi:hypothetical protein